MFSKRIGALLLTLTACAASLTGCGGKDNREDVLKRITPKDAGQVVITKLPDGGLYYVIPSDFKPSQTPDGAPTICFLYKDALKETAPETGTAYASGLTPEGRQSPRLPALDEFHEQKRFCHLDWAKIEIGHFLSPRTCTTQPLQRRPAAFKPVGTN